MEKKSDNSFQIISTAVIMLRVVLCSALLAGAAVGTPHGHSHDDLGLPPNPKDRVLLDAYKFPASKDGVSKERESGASIYLCAAPCSL